MEHTKLPWKIGSHQSTVVSDQPTLRNDKSEIEYYGGHLIGESMHSADALFIVKACNNHQKLVDALSEFALLNPNFSEHSHFKGLILQAQQTINEINKVV